MEILGGTLLDEAGRLAVAAATAAVTRFGSQFSYPDRAEVEKIFASVSTELLLWRGEPRSS